MHDAQSYWIDSLLSRAIVNHGGQQARYEGGTLSVDDATVKNDEPTFHPKTHFFQNAKFKRDPILEG